MLSEYTRNKPVLEIENHRNKSIEIHRLLMQMRNYKMEKFPDRVGVLSPMLNIVNLWIEQFFVIFKTLKLLIFH